MARVLHLFNILGAPTEAVWLEYATRLAELGHEIVCGYETLGEAGRATRLPGVPIPRVHVDPTDDVPAQLVALANDQRCPEIELLLSRDFDLVHGHGGTRMLHATPWLRRRVPTIISLYGYDCSRLLRDPCWVERYRWAAEHGAVFVVLHESMREHLLAIGVPDRAARQISLGIRLDDWPFSRDTPRDVAHPRFVFVGRLVPKKAPRALVRAVHLLRRKLAVDVQLDVIGDGPLEAEVARLVRRLGLTSVVRLHGRQPRSEIIRLLRGAEGLVLPSTEAADGDREGTPIVLMEAQALGVPCITTRHSGNADVLTPSMQRFVVDDADPARLADAMAALTRLSDDEVHRLRRSGRRWIESRYDIARTAAAYDALYGELLAAIRPALTS